MKRTLLSCMAFCLGAIALGTAARATETENLGIQVLPAPGAVKIDGKADDWDLTGGIFACSDVENQREKFGVWVYTMYDAQNVYVLARWVDDTPMNNPGQTIADYGFAGDSLQVRFATAMGTPEERVSHWTCWRGVDQRDVMDMHWGQHNGKKGDYDRDLKDAKTEGAQQAFTVNADKKGYIQEIAIPWKLLTANGQPVAAGQKFVMTVEPNLTIGQNGRWSVKDIFRAGVSLDRVFTFQGYQSWGFASVEPKGNLNPPRSLRISDGREFAVHLENGVSVVDWTGLIKTKELEGFETISFTMPEDGYISLNIRNSEGQVVRQLLNCTFYPKGKHDVKWDGLTTMNFRTPGAPVPAGSYTWDAIWHKGIGLRLRGWAANGGNAPWDSGPTSNWGGDHGIPVTAASDGNQIYLGWSGAEAGKALVVVNPKGEVQWRNNRGGMAGAELVAVDNGIVYAQNWGGDIYRLETKKGSYTSWTGTDSSDIYVHDLLGVPAAADTNSAPRADAMFAHAGKLYLGLTQANLVLVVDGQSGKLIKKLTVPSPTDIEVTDKGVFVVSGGNSVVTLNVDSGEIKPVITGLKNARALAIDTAGRFYIGEREPNNQVQIFGADAKPAGSIGMPGGRPMLGKWNPEGVAFISGLAVDGQNQLWVAEADNYPRRVSVWNTQTSKFVQEFFGPSTYGALGGAIDPQDPNVMVGQGCEWRIDPKTGHAVCVAVITRNGMENTRFGIGSNGKLYAAIATTWTFDLGDMNIYERVGEGQWKLRSRVYYLDKDNNIPPAPGHGQTGAVAKTAVWADANDDQQIQPDERRIFDGITRFAGWYMPMNYDMTFWVDGKAIKVAGFTACGAPQYDLAAAPKVAPGWGSADGRLVLRGGEYGVNNGWFTCADAATGKTVWTYPDNFVGVHGSHNACPPEVGMIRGSFGPCGAVKLPEPVGNIWVIPTNVGEWHIVTERGFYLTRLFQGDPMLVQWPEKAVPGAVLDSVPPGLGGEDFGGSICLGTDGKLYVQAGKTGFWNVEVIGLDAVQAIKGDAPIAISNEDITQAKALREHYLQGATGTQRVAVKKLTPKFTGNLEQDFQGAEVIRYKKQEEAAVASAAAWDDQNLYLAWDVKDNSPWTNSAAEASQMYIGGDTVDFQLGTDPQAKKDRGEPAAGDLRLSIGNFQGKPTAVIYRKVSTEKKPKVFSSGVVREYPMDFVDVLANAQITVTPKPNKSGYVVEAAIPLAALGLTPADKLVLRGDFGVTHGDPAGQRTRLRSHWSNQHTGIVDDAVFELQMEPKNWGELMFSN